MEFNLTASDILGFVGFLLFLLVSGLTILGCMAIYYKNEPVIKSKEIELEKIKKKGGHF